jgi:hypothetical protein
LDAQITVMLISTIMSTQVASLACACTGTPRMARFEHAYSRSMVGGIRKALFWLLLLALPLHGVAGGAMKACMEMPMPISQSTDHSATRHNAAADLGSIAQASEQHGEPDCGTMATGGHPVKSSMGGCAASAACGLVAATATPPALFFAPAVAASPAEPPSTPDAGFFTGAPDRPPRLHA